MTVSEARESLKSLCSGRRKGKIGRSERGPVVVVSLENAAARSAITPWMMVDLADLVLEFQSVPPVAILLASDDRRAFCSGGDLREVTRAVATGAPARAMCVAMAAVLDGLLDLPSISVAAVDGAAVGGGAELLTATDFRVASSKATLHFVQASLGIAPGWGGTGRLVRLLGRRTALRVLTAPRPLSSGEALALGLIDRMAERDALDGALDFLSVVLEQPPDAIRAVKRQVAAAAPARERPVDVEAEAFGDVWGGPAHAEALARLERHLR